MNIDNMLRAALSATFKKAAVCLDKAVKGEELSKDDKETLEMLKDAILKAVEVPTYEMPPVATTPAPEFPELPDIEEVLGQGGENVEAGE